MKRKQRFLFGKYLGKRVRAIIRTDPGYILWLQENGIVHFKKGILSDCRYNIENADYGYDDENYGNGDYYSNQYDRDYPDDYDYDDPFIWEGIY